LVHRCNECCLLELDQPGDQVRCEGVGPEHR